MKTPHRLKEAIESFWGYYEPDDEWRHLKGNFATGDYAESACIYFYGYEDGKCGLRIMDSDEYKFPDLWSAKVFGYMFVTYNF